VDRLWVAQLAGLSMQYRGKDLGEQESELTVAFVRIEEKSKSPILTQKTTGCALGTIWSGKSSS
jgi:hypothetical protein